jgi:hypothetical protein
MNRSVAAACATDSADPVADALAAQVADEPPTSMPK